MTHWNGRVLPPIENCPVCNPPWWHRLLPPPRLHGKDHPPDAHGTPELADDIDWYSEGSRDVTPWDRMP